ncbi:MAG: VPLPA-CTERM sorting domain-containing protein [Paracoccus sp. (in: a-proteobacteria)]|uniref:VPLPA-CTERM sorting domain-containing protein n=1 Tax=Paracoccus sp. TaxID=267 RepID=UPI0026DF7CFC|nr:VPLPA-CTERM sorting domain-containing protein [Paracoccus sp. (in: a-proteobacteria)]MDO5613043.1 VPLPA-CTERM sorting domain-containing protein [Paracoccus sp. (in: a-proteobacteria)]
MMNPVAVETTGTARQNATRTWSWYSNPWPTAGVDPNKDPTAWFTGLGPNSSATYAFDLSDGASFVWGTPDFYNRVEFLLGDTVVDSFQLTARNDLGPASRRNGAALAVFSNIAGGVFDGMRFSTPRISFEYANLTTTVTIAPIPLPAGGVLLLTALGGLAIARKRKQDAQA